MTDAPLPLPTLPPLPRRFLALWLPFLATDRLAIARRPLGEGNQDRADPPQVVAGRQGAAMRLTAVDAAAARLGLRPGIGLADARALHPGLGVTMSDPAADRHLLDAVAGWCERYTPLVALDGDDGVMLDISGSAHLFGGAAALRLDGVQRLAGRGLTVRGAVAPWPSLAHGLARHGRVAQVEPAAVPLVLEGLPLAALGVEAPVIRRLAEAGFTRIGEVLALPRAPLAARFGDGLCRRLDQLLGLVGEPITPRRPVPAHCVERRLLEPVTRDREVIGLAALLAGDLAAGLAAQGLGARRFILDLYRVDGLAARVEAGASRPLGDAVRMARLLADRLNAPSAALDAGFGFELARLAAYETAPLTPVQGDFDRRGRETAAAVACLFDRLSLRLGAGRLRRLAVADRHGPEAASRALVITTAPTAGASPLRQDSLIPSRPLRLPPRGERVEAMAMVPDGPPVHFRWRNRLHRVAHAEGPERIAADWWRADGPTRDYFRVETTEGLRLWLCRDGLYGQETAEPRWFLCGLFG